MTQIQNIEGAIAEGAGTNRTYALRDALNPGALLFSEELNRHLEEPRVENDQPREDSDEAEPTIRTTEDDRDRVRDDDDDDRSKEREAGDRPHVAADAVTIPVATPAPEILTTQPAAAVQATEIREVTAESTSTTPARPTAGPRTGSVDTAPQIGRPETSTVAAQEADRSADPTVSDPVRQLRQGRTEQVPTAARPETEALKVDDPREVAKKDSAEAPRVRAETESRAAEKADRKEPQTTERSLRAQTAEIRNQQQNGERTQRTTGRTNTVPSPSTSEPPTDTKADSKPSDSGARAEAPDRPTSATGAGTKSANTTDTGASTSGTIAGVQSSGAASASQSAATPNQPAGVLGVSSTNAAKGTSAARPAQKAFQASRPVPVDRILTQVRNAVRGGVQDIKIRLDPPELGRLNLRLQMDGDSLTVTVRASSAEVAAALRSELASFHDTLKDAGIDLTSLDIDVENDDATTERGLAHGDRDSEARPQHEQVNGTNESTTSGSSTGKRRSPLGGMLDVTA